MQIMKKLLDRFRKPNPTEHVEFETGFYWIRFTNNPERQAKYGQNEFGFWSAEKQKFLLIGNQEATPTEIELKSSKICGPPQP